MALITCPGCDTSISDQAPTCPNCGRPLRGHSAPAAHPGFATPPATHVAQKPKKKQGCVACGIVVLLAIGIAAMALIRYFPHAKSAAQPLTSESAADKARKTAAATLEADGFADVDAAARLCEEAGSVLSNELRARCAAAHMTQAQRAFATKDLELARKSLEKAMAEGTSPDTRREVEARMQKVVEKMRHDVAEQTRNGLAEQLRVKLDVGVVVRGIDSDRITLRADRIDAAWTDEFRKSDSVRQLREAGFQRVELGGGHGYRENLDWSGMPAH